MNHHITPSRTKDKVARGRGAVLAGIALSVLTLAGCDDPTLNAGISIGAGGLAVTPSISGSLGGIGVALSP